MDILIFVTLGTQDKSFKRLLDIIEQNIRNGIIKEKVVVQSGYTKYSSTNMQIFDYVSPDTFEKYIDKCSILITHGGVGSIMNGLKKNKLVIACPRLKKYNEHTNDHQMDIVKKFENEKYILALYEDIELKDLLKSKNNLQKYKSNKDNFIKIIKEYIDNN